MQIVIELCHDGCFEPVQFVGAFDTPIAARAAMHKRVEEVTEAYTKWRGIPFDPQYHEFEPLYEARGYDGEGYVFEWLMFDTERDVTQEKYG